LSLGATLSKPWTVMRTSGVTARTPPLWANADTALLGTSAATPSMIGSSLRISPPAASTALRAISTDTAWTITAASLDAGAGVAEAASGLSNANATTTAAVIVGILLLEVVSGTQTTEVDGCISATKRMPAGPRRATGGALRVRPYA
jgi:hypothetical protein